MNIVIFTKTLWDEPPRIRHQFAHLLSKYGHNIIFVEKPSFWQIKTKCYWVDKIKIYRFFELLHHQLRPFRLLIIINTLLTKYILKSNLFKSNIDLVINFNYDFYFLKDIFSNIKVLTIINDDFIAQAKPWMIESIDKQLKITCQNSDKVFTVSYPLQVKLKEFLINDVELLLPWADSEYIPIKRNKPNKILIWGYIGHRYNFDLIKSVAMKYPEYIIDIIGPVNKNISSILQRIVEDCDNIYLHGTKNIDEIEVGDYFVCLTPYYELVETRAISITNKCFQVLARGIPCVNSGMPNFIEKTFIKNCKNYTEIYTSINEYNNNFNKYQADLKEFVNKNQGVDRYDSFAKNI
jgi:hypothetical protein